jgi:hypothetical protein
MNPNALGAIPQVPITIKRGGTFYLPFTYIDSSGVAIDLTRYNARMQIWSSETASGTAILDIGTYGTHAEQGSIVIDPIAFGLSITILSSFTGTLANSFSQGWHEFHLIDGSNNDIPLFEGSVCFEPGGIR